MTGGTRDAATLRTHVGAEALDVAEFEADLLKAIQAGNQERTGKVYRKLLQARITLARRQLESLDRA